MTRLVSRSHLLVLSATLGLFPSGTLSFHSREDSRRAEASTVLAGGCFWGVEYVFEHVRGVRSVTSGFARDQVTGTQADLPQAVEAVKIVYDPAVVTYKQLLDVFYRVAHDPTSKDRQGPDEGAEYRAVVFTQSAADVAAVKEYLVELESATHFAGPIVTEVRTLERFATAEAFHQDYSFHHLTDGYVVQNDIPKLERLKKEFPALYTDQRAP